MAVSGIKGFNDILPENIAVWQYIEETARRIFERYGFSEIRVPIMEKTDLFCRSIGDDTDIVEKEMYTFTDKGDNRVTLRPEGTAGVMRAFIEHKLYTQDPVAKLFYMGPMFRYERPQKGRYRQFHQIGVEALGISDPRIDAQILAMLCHFFAELGLDEPTLRVNSLGCNECRPVYRKALKEFLFAKRASLCEDCLRRYEHNPLRALDCKSVGCQTATIDAPSVLDYLCRDCDVHFSRTQFYLKENMVAFSLDPRMVRGLDYYTRTTFELVTGLLGAQSAVAAGGRYDGLIADLGGPKSPGIGFAMGVERVALLLSTREFSRSPDLFIASLGEIAQNQSFQLMCSLQKMGIWVESDFEGKSLKSQMRRADKFKSRFTLIVGENEIVSGKGILKLMSVGTQQEVQLDAAAIRDIIAPIPS
jgi:histidyl-tRNA synthetase